MILNFDLSLLCKLKGFDKPTIHYYYCEKDGMGHSNTPTRTPAFTKNWNLMETRVSAPTYDEVIDWLSEFNIDLYSFRVRTIENDTPWIIKINDLRLGFKDIYINHGLLDEPINHWKDKYLGLDKGIEYCLIII